MTDPITAIVGGSVLGAGASIIGGSKAAKAQTSAANTASATQEQIAAQSNQLQRDMFDKTQANLQPYMTAGNAATADLSNRLTDLTKPITMDQATLEQTPGYQFNLSQGLKSVQNSAAARGLGSSGAAYKGAATYATGIADSTYQNQFNNAVTNQTNTYNRLMGVSQLGANAAAGVGSYGTQTASNIANTNTSLANNLGSNIVGAGNARAGAYMNMANGTANAAYGVPNYLLAAQYNQNVANAQQGMYGNNMVWNS